MRNSLFQRTILARRLVSQWFHGADAKERDGDSNKRRSHFITILEATFTILFSGEATKSPRSASNCNVSCDDMKQFAVPVEKAFSALTVEDIVDAQPEHDRHEIMPKIVPAGIMRDEADTVDDFLFAIECFLHELQAVRSTIKDRRMRYKEGGDLILASLMTNTAIDPVRQAGNELEHMVERPKKYPAQKYPVRTFPAILYWETQVAPDPSEKIDKDQYVLPPKSLAFQLTEDHDRLSRDLWLWEVYNGFQVYITERKALRMWNKNAFGEVSLDMFESEQIHPIAGRTIEWTQTFRLVRLSCACTFGNDELSRGMKHMCENHKIYVWLSFCVQIFFHIQDTLGESLGNPLLELQHDVRNQLNMFEKSKGSMKYLVTHDEPKKALDYLQHFFDEYKKFTLDDHFANCLKNDDPLFAECPIIEPMFRKSYYTFKRHPLRCGLLKYNFWLLLQSTGTGLERLSETIWSLSQI
ncbi:hypothetical protein BCR34DRAFT_593081 [Clohesyomyces aquaticus]|uniref:DUF6604 domain-containing protein n=1 Tax=Clohesyomyces aquaticus TaxID=1231657 RepID=A0A1Y1YLF2_9PLEO|nr:hypothetical protein BCR34DRAFT_593081 [Clohesyomyces aquaticus]